MTYSKHFTYSTETEIDLMWKCELQQVDTWVKDHGIKLFHNKCEGVWYDAEGNNGFKCSFNSRAYSGVNWNKGRMNGGTGKVYSAETKREREILEKARAKFGVNVNVGADIRKGKDGRWYAVEK